MKKHLIAAAVAGALAVPAMAQVTISGNIEAGWASVEKSATHKVAGLNGTDNLGTANVNKNVSMSGTPNITFTATEDLGGGLKASAVFQQVIESSGESDEDFEVAKVAVSGGFGTIALGRDSDAAQEAGASYRFFGDIGRSSLRNGTWKRNTIQYTSPSISGFTVGLFTQQTGDTAANTDGETAQSIIVKGSMGALNFGISSQTYTAAATAANTSGVDDKHMNISASYDFGMAKVGAAYFTLTDGSAADEKTKMTGLHVMVPVSSALSVGVAQNQYKDDDDKATTTHLAAKYALSKRTAVYFAYETVKTDGNAPIGISNSLQLSSNGLGTAFVADETTKGYGFSISHNF
jgi:predicted porin